MVFEKRQAGVLLPIFSLPSKYGIGTFGKEAYNFIDKLKAGKQSYWQVLPHGPTGYGDSPYQPYSTFAGNPYFIDLEMLIDRILVSASDIGRHEVRLTLSGHVLGGTEIVLQRSLEGMLIVTLQCTDISSFQTLVASQMELKARLEDYENRSVQVSVDIDKERNDADRRSRGYTEQEPQEA